jgi:hypothetical protein
MRRQAMHARSACGTALAKTPVRFFLWGSCFCIEPDDIAPPDMLEVCGLAMEPEDDMAFCASALPPIRAKTNVAARRVFMGLSLVGCED